LIAFQKPSVLSPGADSALDEQRRQQLRAELAEMRAAAAEGWVEYSGG
jgi:hypothetical protein